MRLQGIELGEGPLQRRGGAIPFQPKHFIAADLGPLAPAWAPAHPRGPKGASLPGRLGLRGQGQGLVLREKPWPNKVARRGQGLGNSVKIR